MTIWVINHYAGGPGIGTGWRHWELCRRWQGAGCRVRVFAASTEIGGKQGPCREGSRSIEGVPFEFVRVPSYSGNGAGRMLNMLAFATGLHRVARRVQLTEAEFPGVVISSSPHPLSWPPACRIARSGNAAFVPEVRDAWPESLTDLSGLSRLHPFALLCKRLARSAFDRADAVMSSLPHIADHVSAHSHRKCRVISAANGVDVGHQQQTPLPDDLQRVLDSAERHHQRVVVYAGAMGIPNALDQLVDAVALLPKSASQKLTLLMIGAGSEHLRLKHISATRGLGLQFVGAQPQPVVTTALRRCHAAFIGWLDRPVYRFGLSPQKLPMMLASGLPIVHAVPRSMAEWASGIPGWVCSAGEPSSIATALSAMLGTTAPAMSELRNASIRCALARFDWAQIAERVLAELKEVQHARRVAKSVSC